MAGERQNWYPYFNPCGGQPAEGYVFKRCFEDCQKGGANCLPGKAWQMVGYVVKEGSSMRQERADFAPYLKSMMGRKMVRMDGTPITLAPDNFNELLDETVTRADLVLNAMSVCTEKTIPLTPEYLDKCTHEQRQVLDRMQGLSQRARRGFVYASQLKVEEFVGEMKETLGKAIELDLDDLGLVTRQALAYGMGERVLAKRGIPVGSIPTQVGKLGKASSY